MGLDNILKKINEVIYRGGTIELDTNIISDKEVYFDYSNFIDLKAIIFNTYSKIGFWVMNDEFIKGVGKEGTYEDLYIKLYII